MTPGSIGFRDVPGELALPRLLLLGREHDIGLIGPFVGPASSGLRQSASNAAGPSTPRETARSRFNRFRPAAMVLLTPLRSG